MMTVPFDRAERMPSAPVSTASTWGVPVTQRMIVSHLAASAAGVSAAQAPPARRSSVGWLPG